MNMNWLTQIEMAANFASAITCASVAGAIIAFWLDKRHGLPYGATLPIMSAWIILCGVTRLLEVAASGGAFHSRGLLVVLEVARAVLGIPVAYLVWYAVKELHRFASPRQMQAAMSEAMCYIGRNSERMNDGPADSTARHSLAVGRRDPAVLGVRQMVVPSNH